MGLDFELEYLNVSSNFRVKIAKTLYMAKNKFF